MQSTQKPGKYFVTKDKKLCVNFHNTFFIMSHIGNYVIWTATLHHGKLMPQQEWMRIRDIAGGEKVVKELTPFQNKRAAKIAEELKKNPYFKMTPGQIKHAEDNKAAFKNQKRLQLTTLKTKDVTNVTNLVDRGITKKEVTTFGEISALQELRTKLTA